MSNCLQLSANKRQTYIYACRNMCRSICRCSAIVEISGASCGLLWSITSLEYLFSRALEYFFGRAFLS